jgi:hypothetical protein
MRLQKDIVLRFRYNAKPQPRRDPGCCRIAQGCRRKPLVTQSGDILLGRNIRFGVPRDRLRQDCLSSRSSRDVLQFLIEEEPDETLDAALLPYLGQVSRPRWLISMVKSEFSSPRGLLLSPADFMARTYQNRCQHRPICTRCPVSTSISWSSEASTGPRAPTGARRTADLFSAW